MNKEATVILILGIILVVGYIGKLTWDLITSKKENDDWLDLFW